MLAQKGPSPQQIDFARDSYDDCVADLDEQLGCLIDELARRGVLERTWVIVTADHGESFGEQPGVFWHGTSLYQAQLHVPLVIVPPAGGPPPTNRQPDGKLAGPGGDDRRCPGFSGRFPFPRNDARPVLEGVILASVRPGRGVRAGAFRSRPARSFDPDPRNGSRSRDGHWPP